MAKQTKTYLMNKLREIGVEPASRHGQNFLIDLNLVHLIVNSADLGPHDVVLEVGTGVGSLTTLMAPLAGAVVTVEIDANLFELASEELFDFPNVTMLKQDALKNKNRFAPEVMDAVGEALARVTDSRLKLVANLPYNVATPVISNLLSCEHTPHSMVCTIQKEVADRLVAKPWSKDYGSLSVWVQSQCATEIVRVMSPKVFWPAPKVDSAIVRLVVDHERRDAIPDRQYFKEFTRALFIHKRKFMRANAVAALKHHLDKEQVDELLTKMEFGPDARTEQVDIPTLLRFSELARAAAPDWKL